MTAPQLDIQAGPRALAHIRENGLSPEDISLIPGAAGGPKGLGLAKFDEWLFADWLPQSFAKRQQPIHLVGASIGAWRFAAVCRGRSSSEIREVLAAFCKGYSEQRYAKKVSPKEISTAARSLLHDLFRGREQQVLSHPHYQLNMLVIRGRGLLQRERRAQTPAAFALAALANMAGRQHLRHFMERNWFHDGRGSPLLKENERFDQFTTHLVTLTPQNFTDALIASGSIPMVLEGVADIHGARPGTYWDGGLIDYHLHLPYPRVPGLVLYPHFTDRIVPGWLDKALPWRKARGAWLDNVILVSPSRDYLSRLPLGKLPDRNDFKRFIHDFEGRLRYWRFAMAESARLRDEWAELVASGRLVDRLKPI
ncbi:MAG: patatin-like phospholipase family protein [Betaproteobacteria bacterium]|nr:patatin-like phospholipase family protein [Betaproteobacteria bacterium]